MKIRIAVLILFAASNLLAANKPSSSIKRQILVKATSSWDGTGYRSYPAGRPELSVLKITIPPYTTMDWHSHPIPNAAYVLSGKLTIERQDGIKKQFTAGQTAAESVDVSHRGITGKEGAVLIVFYAGRAGLPLSQQKGRTVSGHSGNRK